MISFLLTSYPPLRMAPVLTGGGGGCPSPCGGCAGDALSAHREGPEAPGARRTYAPAPPRPPLGHCPVRTLGGMWAGPPKGNGTGRTPSGACAPARLPCASRSVPRPRGGGEVGGPAAPPPPPTPRSRPPNLRPPDATVLPPALRATAPVRRCFGCPTASHHQNTPHPKHRPGGTHARPLCVGRGGPEGTAFLLAEDRGTTNRQPPTASNRQPPPTANRQPPPTPNLQSPPAMVEHMSYPRSFCNTAVLEHFNPPTPPHTGPPCVLASCAHLV